MTLRKAADTGGEIFAWAVILLSCALLYDDKLSEPGFLILIVTALAVATGLRVRKLRAGKIELDGDNDGRPE